MTEIPSDIVLKRIVGQAIADTLDEFGFDDYLENWLELKPNGDELTLTDDQAWRGFLGSIIARVNRKLSPCKTADRSEFLDFSSKTLSKLRNAIINNLECA